MRPERLVAQRPARPRNVLAQHQRALERRSAQHSMLPRQYGCWCSRAGVEMSSSCPHDGLHIQDLATKVAEPPSVFPVRATSVAEPNACASGNRLLQRFVLAWIVHGEPPRYVDGAIAVPLRRPCNGVVRHGDGHQCLISDSWSVDFARKQTSRTDGANVCQSLRPRSAALVLLKPFRRTLVYRPRFEAEL